MAWTGRWCRALSHVHVSIGGHRGTSARGCSPAVMPGIHKGIASAPTNGVDHLALSSRRCDGLQRRRWVRRCARTAQAEHKIQCKPYYNRASGRSGHGGCPPPVTAVTTRKRRAIVNQSLKHIGIVADNRHLHQVEPDGGTAAKACWACSAMHGARGGWSRTVRAARVPGMPAKAGHEHAPDGMVISRITTSGSKLQCARSGRGSPHTRRTHLTACMTLGARDA